MTSQSRRKIPSPSPAGRVAQARVRVRYAETDKMGIVYYAHYFVWFEIGRTEWLRETGWTYRAMEEEGYGLPVIEARCEYQSSARYDDELRIETQARLVTPVRLAFEYRVARVDDEQSMALGVTVHATVDRSGRPVRLPARVRALLV
jgi:acyl-CoA thioester hydrolase